MNLFQMASRGVDLDALPEDDAPRSLIDFGPSAAPAGRMAVPQEFDSLFDAAASEYGVDPTILKGIAYAESRFRPDIISGKVASPAGAVGLMQFMPATAKEMGINPLDPAEAVFGAAAYLRQSLDKFDGDVEKAVASYNFGRNRDLYGKSDWHKGLPAETRNYVGTVLEFADNVAPVAAPVGGNSIALPEGIAPSTAGGGRGAVNPTAKDSAAQAAARETPKPGILERVGNELGQLRDEFFSGVTGVSANMQAVNTAAAANQLLQRQDALAKLERSGQGDSPEAQGLRKYITHASTRLGGMAADAAEAGALSDAAGRMTTRPELRAVSDAKTFDESWEAFKKNPYAVIAGATAQSGAQMIPMIVAAALTGPVGGAAVAGGTSAFSEFGSGIREFARDNGVDPSDKEALGRLLADRDMLQAAMTYAGKGGMIVGALDAASGGVAGKTLVPRSVKNQLVRQAINMPLQAGVQGAMGGAGEAGKQLAQKGEIDQPGQVLTEIVAELGGAPVEVLALSKDARQAFTSRQQAASVPRVQDQPTTPQAPVVAAVPAEVPQAPVAAPAAKAEAQPAPASANWSDVATAQKQAQAEQAVMAKADALPAATRPSDPASTQAVSNIEALLGPAAQPTATPAAPATEQAAPTVEQAEQQLAARESAQAALVEMQMRSTGTLMVKGDPVALRARLTPAGVDNTIAVPGGLIVARSQAAKAQQALSTQPQPNPAPATPLQTPVAEVSNVSQSTPQTAQQPAEAASPAAPVVGRADAAVPAGAVPATGTTAPQAPDVAAPTEQYSKGMTPELASAIMAIKPPARATVESVNQAMSEVVPSDQPLPRGLGRVVVATAKDIKARWEPLIGSTSMDSESAGRAQGFYDPRTKTVFIVADNIRPGEEKGVIAHELMHKHGQAVLGKEGWDKLHQTIGTWANAKEGSQEREVYAEASARVEAAGEGLSNQELFPYAVQVATEMGIKPSISAPLGSVSRWLYQVRLALQQAWTKVTGKPESFKTQDMVNLAFGIAQRENPAQRGELDNATKAVAAPTSEPAPVVQPAPEAEPMYSRQSPDATAKDALEQLSGADNLFVAPKSDARTVEEITAELDPSIQVSQTVLGNETMHTLRFPDGTKAYITERPAGPGAIYGVNEATGSYITERPGENAEAVAGKGDVWIDVLGLKPGGGGGKVYNIAANYAFNTDQVFIGDPSGLSDLALRRRAEQMLSSALKFGTTEHLAPHPRQIVGDAALGVPPLRWVYGDDAANIQSLIDVNQAALDNEAPYAKHITYDLQDGTFRDSRTGEILEGRGIDAAANGGRDAGALAQPSAGWRTIARGSVFRALLGRGAGERQGEGGSQRTEPGPGRGEVLDGAVRERDQSAPPRVRGVERSSRTLADLAEQRDQLASDDPEQRIFYSRTTADDLKSSMGAMTPDQEAAWSKAAGLKTPPTLKERAAQMKANFSTKARQGIVDQFAPIADLDQRAYMLARMSKGSDGTMEAALLYGRPFLRDGVPDVDVNEGGFARVLAGLKGEHDRFLWWVAALRAENLKAQGKENLLDTPDIDALKTLNAGTMADGSDRVMTYAEALLELNDFNNAVLQMAKDSGLIDQAAVDLMRDQPYVPFFRLMDEEGKVAGPRFSAGLTNQKAWKKLKGGTQQINADLLQNMLLNWSSLYASAARNRAALATMDAAEQLAVAYQVPEGTKGAAKVMRDGVTEHWLVEDPYLLEAISALNYTPSPLMKALSKPKQLLTWGVTVNPTFKIRNLIRDSVSAIAMADLSYNFVGNAVKGWKLMDAESQTYASMLASGGVIKFGTQENTDRLRNKVAKLGGVVLDHSAAAKLWGQAKGVYEAYQELGDRSENVNRTALYDRLIKKGYNHADASFMARDLMDFSMGGSWPIVRFLTQTVPFLNARLQGLYKLGRAAGEDPARFAAVVGAVSIASLVLLAKFHDDEDWRKREDWDRDGYWWIKIGSTAYRIPKPFEVGALGTLAERTAELIFSKEMDNKRFMERLRHMLASTFSLDPIPQAIKPLLDVSANKDSFTGRAIETQADQKLRPKDRYSERTPEIARLLGSWGLPDPLRLVKGEWTGLSPKQIEHLLRGYFSWAATATFAVTDAGASLVTDKGEKPDLRLKDMFLAGNFVETLPSGSSRYVSKMYEQAKDAEQAYASYQAAVKAGDKDRMAEIRTKDLDKLKSRELLHEGTQALARINLYSRMVEADKKMTGEQKRKRLDELEQQRHKIAQKVIGAGPEGRTQSK